MKIVDFFLEIEVLVNIEFNLLEKLLIRILVNISVRIVGNNFVVNLFKARRNLLMLLVLRFWLRKWVIN